MAVKLVNYNHTKFYVNVQLRFKTAEIQFLKKIKNIEQ